MKRVIGSVCVLVLAILGFACARGVSYTEVKEEDVAATLAEVKTMAEQAGVDDVMQGWEVSCNVKIEFDIQSDEMDMDLQSDLSMKIQTKTGADGKLVARADGGVSISEKGNGAQNSEKVETMIYIADGMYYEKNESGKKSKRPYTEEDGEGLFDNIYEPSMMDQLEWSKPENFVKIEVSGKEGESRYYRLTMDLSQALQEEFSSEECSGQLWYVITYEFDADGKLVEMSAKADGKLFVTGNLGTEYSGNLTCKIDLTMKPFSGDIEEPADLDQYVGSLAA